MALARTGDPAALAALAARLEHEQGDAARLELGYALGRGGDPKGPALLVAALASPRRDVKADAAHALALLGDNRAIPTLAGFLDISQTRLSAAEQLAQLAEPRALKALDAIRADPKASPDDQTRALVALGLAGRADVAPALQKLLADQRFNAFAAIALARLGDAAARPVLVGQLGISALRVGAARALRRLSPAPQLDGVPALLDAVAAARDTEQAQLAETILILAGPVAWSERE
jgi:HEAT repeat protein